MSHTEVEYNCSAKIESKIWMCILRIGDFETKWASGTNITKFYEDIVLLSGCSHLIGLK